MHLGRPARLAALFVFALSGTTAAQTFVEITDPGNPIVADAGPPSK